MSALGSLVVNLALNHAEFTTGIKKSEQASLQFAKNVQAILIALVLPSVDLLADWVALI